MHGHSGHGHGGLSAKSKSSHNLPHLPAASSRRDHHDFHKTPETDGGVFDQGSSPEKAQQSYLTQEKTAPQQTDAGATFDELVDRLLSQPMSKPDTKFAAIFLALYRKFASPGELLDAILDRFDAVSQDSSDKMTKAQAQLRHLTILDSWIGHYPGDFAYPSTRKKLEKFIGRISSVRLFSVGARELSANLENVAEDDDTDWDFSDRKRERKDSVSVGSLARELVGLAITGDDTPPQSPSTTRSASNSTSTSSSQALLHQVETAQRLARHMTPNPRCPLSKIQWRALMESPEEIIAKELTRMDWIMFTSIRPRDLVRHVSLSSNAKAKCRSLENVQRMSDHFNHLAFWVSNFILLRDKPKHRALMLEKFMKIARELRKLNNYNALGAVLAGINSSSVHRLQATKELIPHASSKDFMKLEILMSSQKSHFAYRLAWENTPGERIPYIPLHRRDLVSASEGNKTFIGMDDKSAEELWMNGTDAQGRNWKDVRINWKKFEVIGEVIVGVQRAQGVPYPLAHFVRSEEVRALVTDTEIKKDEDVSSAPSLLVS
jgi:RasGEF domain/RasGEF N-terminal motif